MPAAPFAPPIGWPLLPTPDAAGRLAYPDLAQSVRERLRVLLLVRPGELLGHATLGVGLAGFLGQPASMEVRRAIHDRIVQQVGRWEPRALLERVEVYDDASGPGRLRLELHYRLRRTGEPALLGLTMDLGA